MDTLGRSLAKTMSYRLFSTMFTAALVWVLTGNLGFAATIGVLDSVGKLGVFYAHERIWNRIPCGRVRPPEYEI